MTNFKELSNEKILSLYNQLLKEIKPIPFLLVQEINKRSLVKGYKGIFTS